MRSSMHSMNPPLLCPTCGTVRPVSPGTSSIAGSSAATTDSPSLTPSESLRRSACATERALRTVRTVDDLRAAWELARILLFLIGFAAFCVYALSHHQPQP